LAIFARDMAGNRGDDVIGDAQVIEVHNLGAEMSGLRLGYISRPDQLVGQHQINHPNPGGLSFRLQLGHLVRRDKAEVDQDVYQIIVFFSHSCESFCVSVVIKLNQRVLVGGRLSMRPCIVQGNSGKVARIVATRGPLQPAPSPWA